MQMMTTDNPSQVAADCGTVVQRRGSGEKSELREALRATRFDASDLAPQQRICRELQGFIRAPALLAWGVRRG
ncbi:hypothetical protein [Belnapia rosea]|uniref:Uncharacterized protein n=1 Tax=Belnapia rosea TaxID=938405 RepID=A0A1G6PST9_9PROT|nr:hypothetical protein [Belnapia rosea]SDC83203.1 hypothetical protein SAMN04487779_1002508 [Belnapia rosea]